MSPYDPDATIKELLIMARVWIKRRAQEHMDKQEALTRARTTAENEGIATPELSKRDFDMLCKVFKANTPGCEHPTWYKTFKQSFEVIRESRKAAERQERQAEEDRINQAKIRNDERKARLMALIEKAEEEEFKDQPLLQAILTPLTYQPGEQASSSVGPRGALTAEPASSGEVSQAARGDYIPQTPQRLTQNQCQICGLSAHEHSICVFCKQVFCDRHRYNTKCCQTWKKHYSRGKMHMSLQMPESSTADGGTGNLRAAGMGCQGAEGGT